MKVKDLMEKFKDVNPDWEVLVEDPRTGGLIEMPDYWVSLLPDGGLAGRGAVCIGLLLFAKPEAEEPSTEKVGAVLRTVLDYPATGPRVHALLVAEAYGETLDTDGRDIRLATERGTLLGAVEGRQGAVFACPAGRLQAREHRGPTAQTVNATYSAA